MTFARRNDCSGGGTLLTLLDLEVFGFRWRGDLLHIGLYVSTQTVGD